jgi:hypothetical protein
MYEQEIKTLGENVIWMNGFFEDIFSLMRNIARVFTDQQFKLSSPQYWHNVQAQGPNRFKIPPYYVLYRGGKYNEQPVAINVFFVLDPAFIKLTQFKPEPSIIVVVHPGSEKGKFDVVQDGSERILRDDLVEISGKENNYIRGHFQGGRLSNLPFFTYQVSLEPFIEKEVHTEAIKTFIVDPAKHVELLQV